MERRAFAGRRDTQCDLCTSLSSACVSVPVLAVKRLRIEFYDDSGCRHTVSLEGPLTREKIARILDYAELMGGLSSPVRNHDSSEYGRTKLDRVRDLVVHGLRERTFSSDDVRRHYQQLYADPIPLTTVATYLSRLVDRGLLHRSGSPGRWRYSLVERAPSVRID
jgi:hypothetical protein